MLWTTPPEKWFVQQPQGKTTDQASELPNPELNPLLNPTLGQNLGRWAQAYFTSPPEKREQAVLELLRELQAEEAAAAGQFHPESFPTRHSPSDGAHAAREGNRCAECGHQNAERQRFCGMCGSTLRLEGEASVQPASQRPTGPEPVQNEKPAERPSGPLEPDATCGTLSFFAGVDRQPSLAQVADPPSASAGTAEIHWLRDKNLRDRPVAPEPRQPVKYAVAVLVVLLVVVGFYAQSRSTSARATNSGYGSSVAPVSATPPPSGASATPPAGKTTGAKNPAAKLGNRKPEPALKSQLTGAQTQAAPATSPVLNSFAVTPQGASAGLNNGAADLASAENYLTGKNGPRDSAEAAKFLWRAVGKHNVTAILRLSDLYLTGDGVPKSCDQARILLDAAAQRNSSQAVEKLRELQRSGCQ